METPVALEHCPKHGAKGSLCTSWSPATPVELAASALVSSTTVGAIVHVLLYSEQGDGVELSSPQREDSIVARLDSDGMEKIAVDEFYPAHVPGQRRYFATIWITQPGKFEFHAVLRAIAFPVHVSDILDGTVPDFSLIEATDKARRWEDFDTVSLVVTGTPLDPSELPSCGASGTTEGPKGRVLRPCPPGKLCQACPAAVCRGSLDFVFDAARDAKSDKSRHLIFVPYGCIPPMADESMLKRALQDTAWMFQTESHGLYKSRFISHLLGDERVPQSLPKALIKIKEYEFFDQTRNVMMSSIWVGGEHSTNGGGIQTAFKPSILERRGQLLGDMERRGFTRDRRGVVLNAGSHDLNGFGIESPNFTWLNLSAKEFFGKFRQAMREWIVREARDAASIVIWSNEFLGSFPKPAPLDQHDVYNGPYVQSLMRQLTRQAVALALEDVAADSTIGHITLELVDSKPMAINGYAFASVERGHVSRLDFHGHSGYSGHYGRAEAISLLARMAGMRKTNMYM